MRLRGRILNLTGTVLAACSLISSTFTAAEPLESPSSPEQELATFHFADENLTAELVAAEPDVVAPVAIAWDADGRMFVAEMTDYPSGPVSGRVRMLEDRDGDGRYERSTIFADKIAFPNGVMPWGGGLLVTAAPDILFFKDTNGDGRADERRTILTGFAPGNQQLRANGLFWGLDNWIYGANGRSDGDVRWVDGATPDEKTASTQIVSIRRRDFRFRPGTKQFEAIAGHSQFGCAHDDWGNRFPVFNNIPIRHVIIEQRYLDHQPLLAGTESVVPISAPDDKGRVYYLAPPTLLIPQASDYFTSACGPAVYRGDALGADYYGNFFVCEPVHNLLQRRRLVPKGGTFVAERTGSGKEFLASTDPWFHGVFTATGPDGCLYVVDFYRKYVEHPAWVADELKNTTPWRTGEAHGRIWRIHPKNWKSKTPKPNLGRAKASELVKHLGDANGWWRETAQRLLVERQDRSVVPVMEKMARKSPSPLGRLHALYALEGLNALNIRLVESALRDADPRVREHAVRLSERFLGAGVKARGNPDRTNPDNISPKRIEELRHALFGLAENNDARVRFQLALTLGEAGDDSAKLSALVRLAQRDVEDRWSALALLTSVGSRPWPVWKRLVEESPAWFGAPDGAEAWLVEKLAALAVRSRDETDLREALAFTEQDNQPIYARIVLLSTVAEAEKSEPFLRRLSARDLADGSKSTAKILAEAQRIALSREGPLPIRLAAIRLLGRRPHSSVESLASLLPPQNPPEIQSAAVTALVEMNNPGAAAVAFEGLERCTRSTRQQLITSAPRASALADALLAALEQGRMQLTEVDPSTRQALRRSADTELKQRAERLFRGAISSDRDQVVQSFKPAVEMTGERKHGAEIFAKICLQCHAMQGEGARVGPDLSGIATQSRETMVMNILDPSRQVLPDFVSYTATTADGETLTGLIVAESATGVTLRRPNVPDATVQRSQIKELKADGKSLMPDGLEQGLSVQDMADLLSFLRQPEAALLPKDK